MNARDKKYLDKFLNSPKYERGYPQIHSGCCEPGYTDQLVITANWNGIPNYVFHRLESMGISCEWGDEWLECGQCYKVFRCSPDSYGWEMYGIITDGEAICGDCLDIAEYLESIQNKPRQALSSALRYKYDPADYGYTLIQDDYEAGLHEGMNANPPDILKNLLDRNPTGKFIFTIDEQSQFYITFAVWQYTGDTQEEDTED